MSLTKRLQRRVSEADPAWGGSQANHFAGEGRRVPHLMKSS